MSTEAKPSLDARLTDAVAQVAARLKKKGLEEEYSDELAKDHRGSILVSEAGQIRVQHRGVSLSPNSHSDPLGVFAALLYASAPDTKKLAPEMTDEERAAQRRAFLSRGIY